MLAGYFRGAVVRVSDRGGVRRRFHLQTYEVLLSCIHRPDRRVQDRSVPAFETVSGYRQLLCCHRWRRQRRPFSTSSFPLIFSFFIVCVFTCKPE
ncbi:hypothetical protein LINGRAHAP2_LOCUS33280 [Linum grandiflorum]